MTNSRKKVSILCYDLSNNAVGRAYILAAALKRYYRVEIVGLATTGKVWGPLQDNKHIKFRILPSYRLSKSLAAINGDIIYASKTKGSSLGYALLKSKRQNKPLILDIDDWDLGLYLDMNPLYKVASIVRFWNINNGLYTLLLEKKARVVNSITVSNGFLKEKFGGTLIPHFRDTDQFDPAKFDGEKIKKDLGLDKQKIVLFLGTPRRHKGTSQLIAAVDRLKREDVVLLIVGATNTEKKALPKRPFLKVMGRQRFDEIPKFLAAADIVTIFQSDSRAARGQLPAKLFDAMSMAKPIIASRVSDIPKVLQGCGELVEPGDIEGLTKKISNLLANPRRAKQLGLKAREKCIKEYSYEAIAPKLHAVVEDALAKARVAAKT